MPGVVRVRFLLIIVWSLATASGCAGSRHAVDADAAWETLSFNLATTDPADGGTTIGDSSNPRIALPIDRLRGKWLRFSAVVAREADGIGFRINAIAGQVHTGSVPIVCDGRPTMSRCSTSFWVPPDSDTISAVIWADRDVGRIFETRIDVATSPSNGRTIGHQVDALFARVRADYFRTDDVDWPALERTIAAIPLPPDDLDPAPAIAQYLRSRLPDNRHVFVSPLSRTTAPASATTMPGCDETGDHIGIVTLSGLMQTTGDAPSAYAKTLHDCLLND